MKLHQYIAAGVLVNVSALDEVSHLDALGHAISVMQEAYDDLEREDDMAFRNSSPRLTRFLERLGGHGGELNGKNVSP